MGDKPKSICIISHQHLCRNPRVLKESNALAKLGYNITVLTSVYNASLLEEDYGLIARYQINYTFYNNLINKNITSYKNRFFNKVGRYINKIGVENKWALGYAPEKCLAMALTHQADLYICHQELPTYIGTQLIEKGKKVAFDFEDFYSEDLLPKDRKYRPQNILETAEKLALEKGNLCYTTSTSLAKGLKEKYNSEVTIHTIYNSFPSFNNGQTKQSEFINLIWLSQTIGAGRGLEHIIEALNNCDNNSYVLNLRGNVEEIYKQQLISLLTNRKHQINFLPLIPNEQIQEDLSRYDIGLAIELNTPLSRDLTITNKIFHYLSVGLPVIASSTQGQLSLKEDFNDSIKYFSTSDELVTILQDLRSSDLTQKQKNIKLYKEKYDWNIQEKTLQSLIAKIIF